jgi:hypothetical protein
VAALIQVRVVSVDEEAVVQLNDIGPWVITYIDPKDDPRLKPALDRAAGAGAEPKMRVAAPSRRSDGMKLGKAAETGVH